MSVKIGMMSFAHMHAHGYAEQLMKLPEAQIVGIADDDAERAEKMAAKFQARKFDTYQQLLAADIDAVVICSENVRHREHAEMAAAAGKHVLCEKPLAASVEDGKAMIEACRKGGVKLMTAFPCRYSPAMTRLKALVDCGTIGKVLAAKTTNHGMMPGGWFTDLKLSGGGAVIDHTVHVADLLRVLLGAEPVEVYAEISNLMYHQDYDDIGMLTIGFDNGVFATLDSSWSRPKSYLTWGDVTIDLVGTGGVLSMDMFNQNFLNCKDSDMRTRWNWWGSNLDYGLVKDFVNIVANDLPVTVTGEAGLKAAQVAIAAYESARTGEPVRI